ncbi:MAG: hypothetical protein EP330_14905 [Deltaproteobacteria bacterium]|nr:MAG: hypothetical protein EP330_14905 [Deltaproteobacteria bacterium]
MLRIVVALAWLSLWEVWHAPEYVGWPATAHPWGLAGFVPDRQLAELARAGVVGGAVLGVIGVGARLGFGLVAVCGLYLLAIPQLHGAVRHYHHLWWLAVLLAASPASDALSLRQWRPASGRTLAWGLAAHVAGLLLTLVYFFPGVHKLRVQGVDWAGDNLTLLMYWKWAQSFDFEPLTRIDHDPWLLWLGGLGVLAFEVSAPLWLINRNSRALFVFLTFGFHAATALWFNIHFGILAVCLVVLLPWPEGVGEGAKRPVWPVLAAAVPLLVGVVATGVLGRTQAWPFACYPSFAEPHRTHMPLVEVVAVDAAGIEHEVASRQLAGAGGGQRWVSEVWGVTGHYGVSDPAVLDAAVRRWLGRPGVREQVVDAEVLRVYRSAVDVRPDDVRDGPRWRRGPLIWEHHGSLDH